MQRDGGECWIYYNTSKLSGKKVVVSPGGVYESRDAGVHNVLVWRGTGTYGGLEVEGGRPGSDELLVSHEPAVEGVTNRNEGACDMLFIKFFGPDINADAPMIPRRS